MKHLRHHGNAIKPGPTGELLHRAECGAWARDLYIAHVGDTVTCPGCKRAETARTAASLYRRVAPDWRLK